MIKHNAKIYLCRPDRTAICELNGKQISSVNYEPNLKDFNKLTFNVDRYIDIDGELVESNGYELLSDHMVLYLEGLDYLQMQQPRLCGDGKNEYKEIVAYSDEKTLEDKDLVGISYNKGTPESMEMLATNNVDDLGFAKEFISFVNDDNHELSFMHLVLEDVPSWKLGHVDESLKSKKYSFEAENTTVYAFLTSVVAPVVECIFVFDTIAREVNVYSKNNLGLDSNIFLGFRNLMNSVEVSSSEDSITTQMRVEGDNSLNIRSVNFGDAYLYNLDFYLTTQYFKQETIDKVKQWITWRENNRSAYVDNAKSVAQLQEKIDDIVYRVPSDGCDVDQWDNMDEESLKENLKLYQKTLESLQISVDTRPDSQKYDKPDDLQNRVYQPMLTSTGEVDHQKYMDLLYAQENGYGGYYTYFEIKEYIIPNVQTAIENLTLPDDEKKEYNRDWETNWDLYGINELEAKRDMYNKEIKEFLKKYEKPWSELTEEEQQETGCTETYYNKQHDTYLKYKGYLGDEDTEGTILYKLKQLNAEVDSLKTEQENHQNTVDNLSSQAKLNNSQFGLTADEYSAVNFVLRMGDYTNNNILVTSIDTAVTSFEAMEELFQDGTKKLVEASQPQYSIKTDLDNLLSLSEYATFTNGDKQSWFYKFNVGNFIRVGIRDDYAVKLRLLSYSYNPCATTSNIDVSYTNMINGQTGRDDFADLFDNVVESVKNSISIGTSGNGDDIEYLTNLLEKLTRMSGFRTAVNNSVDSSTLDESVVEALEGKTIKVEKIVGNEAEFNTLFSKYIDADYINARVVISDTGEFKQLSADVANLKNAVIGTSSTETGIIINLSATNAKIDSAWIADLVAKEITVGDLKAGDIVVSDAVRIISQNENGGNLTLNGSTMQFTDKNGNVGIQIGYGNSDTPHLFIQDENGTALWTSQGITDAAIADGLIVNDMIGDTTITKEKLAFNTVETDEDGNVSINNIVANGEKFSVQYDTFKSNTESALESLSNASDSIELAGEQVFTVTNDVISPSSITISAICHNNAQIDKWFVDDVENTSYVASDKLSLTIPSSYMANRKSATIKAQNANGTLYDIFTVYKVVDGKDGTDGKNGSDNIRVEIISSEGEIFKSDTTVTQTILTCYVYQGSTEITPDSYIWMKKTDDGEFIYTGLTTKSITVDLSNFSVTEKYKCQINIAVEDDKVINVDENGTLNVEQNPATIDENGILVYSQTPSIDENGTLFFES